MRLYGRITYGLSDNNGVNPFLVRFPCQQATALNEKITFLFHPDAVSSRPHHQEYTS